MKQTWIRVLAAVLCFGFLVSGIPQVSAEETKVVYPVRQPAPEVENDPEDPEAAQNISGMALIKNSSGLINMHRLFDKNKNYGLITSGSASMTLEHEEGMGYLYFAFGVEYGEYTVTNHDTGEQAVCGTNRFLHELIDLKALFGGPVKSLTVDFANGPVSIRELCVYTPGYLPKHIQAWKVPEEGAVDLILFSTHGDDDQLFFAGLLPYYCALGYEVLVVYMTDHRNNVDFRIREMLNGLWGVGVTNYPVFGSFPDLFSADMGDAYRMLSRYGFEKTDMVAFITEQLRRYHPMVVVGHDFNGEYRHGQHMVYADSLAEAVAVSGDPAQYPDSAAAYGLWDVPKAYFHLYEENPIVMDWDTPMEELDGMTPFEVTQIFGYPQHVSQRESWISFWINGSGFSVKKATDIEKYSPCLYGLFRSTVGPDVAKNDMFENIVSHAEQARLKAEEEARLKAEEEARLQAEEEARKKAEEEARRKAEEEKRLAQERAEAEAAAKAAEAQRALRQKQIFLGGGAVLLVLAVILIVLFCRKKDSKNF